MKKKNKYFFLLFVFIFLAIIFTIYPDLRPFDISFTSTKSNFISIASDSQSETFDVQFSKGGDSSGGEIVGNGSYVLWQGTINHDNSLDPIYNDFQKNIYFKGNNLSMVFPTIINPNTDNEVLINLPPSSQEVECQVTGDRERNFGKTTILQCNLKATILCDSSYFPQNLSCHFNNECCKIRSTTGGSFKITLVKNNVFCINGQELCNESSKEFSMCEEGLWQNKGLVDGKCGYIKTSNTSMNSNTSCFIGLEKCSEQNLYICKEVCKYSLLGCENQYILEGKIAGKCGYHGDTINPPITLIGKLLLIINKNKILFTLSMIGFLTLVGYTIINKKRRRKTRK